MKPIKFAGYIITESKNPSEHGYGYVHEDYDGPEDNRHGFCSTIDECLKEIVDNTVRVLYDEIEEVYDEVKWNENQEKLLLKQGFFDGINRMHDEITRWSN